MENQSILDYVYGYGISSFEEVPFFDLDAAVFAELAYLDFENTSANSPSFKKDSLKNILIEHFSEVRLKENNGYRMTGDDALALACMSSHRYSDVKVLRIRQVFSQEKKIQFFAVEFQLPKGDIVISYRGTDLSITGWEENADLVCYASNPGQRMAASFLQESYLKHPRSGYYITGHSKGGNLAVFAASLSSEKDARRIRNVYSFDGPGLMKEMYDFVGHERIRNKIVFIVPEDDMVGMIMEHEEVSYVVETSKKGDYVNSHYIMNWLVDKDRFVRKSDISSFSKSFSEATDKLFTDYLGDIETRIEFFGFFFQTVRSLGIEDPQKIFDSPVSFFFSFSNQVRKSKNRGMFIRFIKAYISYFGSTFLKKKTEKTESR